MEGFTIGCPSREELLSGDRGCDREASTESFTTAEKIRADLLRFYRKQKTRAAETCEDLVGDQEDFMPAADIGDRPKPALGRDQDTFAPGDGLEDQRADGRLLMKRLGDRFGGCCEGESVEMLVEVLRERPPKGRTGGDGERTEGHSVVGGFKGENAWLSGSQQGGLQGDLDRIGSGDCEIGLPTVDGGEPADLLGELGSQRMAMDIAQAVKKVARLICYGGNDLRVAMSDGRNTKSGGEIEEDISIRVQDIGTGCLLPCEGSSAVDQGVDSRCFPGIQPCEDLAAARTGGRGDDPRE